MYNCSKGFSPSQVLLASCLVQSHLSLLCTLGVTAQVWWDLPEDGHQLPSNECIMVVLSSRLRISSGK